MTGDFSWLGGLFSNLWGWMFIILLLGGSIFVHELGHFLAARWRGMKVDRFSIGFGPKIFGWTGKDGVEYRLSWIPLGGYVALPQLIDMTAVEGEASAETRHLPPVTYLDKMIVVCAGVTFNMLFALLLSLVLWGVGQEQSVESRTQVIGYVFHTMGELRNGGLKSELKLMRGPDAPKLDDTPAPAEGKIFPGDSIVAVDGSPVKDYAALAEAIAFSTGRDSTGHPKVTLTVVRDGQQHDVDILPDLVDTNKRSGDAIRKIGLLPASDFVVQELESPRSPALPLHRGDKILAINGQKVFSLPQISEIYEATKGSPLTFTVERGGKPLDLKIQPAALPRTTPLATITIPGSEAMLDILPIYALDEQGDQAAPATPAQSLLVWNVDNRNGVFGKLRPGDFLRKVNGQPVQSVQQVVDALKATPAGQTAVLDYDSEAAHASATMALPAHFAAQVTPAATELRIGVVFEPQTITIHDSPLMQFANAFNQIFSTLRSLFNPHSSIGIGQLAGPIGISRMIYQLSIEDIRLALWFAFIINVNLAIINLLPIPLLDGGHILFYTIERVRRRALPINIIASAQALFLVLLMGLALFVFVNDLRRWAGDSDHMSELSHTRAYLLNEEDVKFPPRAVPAKR